MRLVIGVDVDVDKGDGKEGKKDVYRMPVTDTHTYQMIKASSPPKSSRALPQNTTQNTEARRRVGG